MLGLVKTCRCLIHSSRLLVAVVALSWLSACQTHHVYPTAPLEYKLAKPTSSRLVDYYNRVLATTELTESNTAIYPLSDGLDAFTARLVSIEAAQVSIDVQYYIYRNDETGTLLTWYLYKAAERGVRVRILLDDMTTGALGNGLAALVRHPNISIRVFNPAHYRERRTWSFVTDFGRMNHRMHNKSLTVDNMLSIVGGRNIGDEYFSANEAVEFGDLDVFMMGAAVDEVSDQFDLYWNSSQVRPVEQLEEKSIDAVELFETHAALQAFQQSLPENQYVRRLVTTPMLEKLLNQRVNWYTVDAEVIFDPPNKLHTHLNQGILVDDLATFFSAAEEQVLIISPYFVPTQSGADELVSWAKSGVDITVVTNSLAATDVLAVHSGYQQYRQQLIEGGIKLYELKADLTRKYKQAEAKMFQGSSRSSLHAKSFVVDDEAIFIGSFNYDPRSAWLNTEMGVIIYDKPFSKKFLTGFYHDLPSKVYQVKVEDNKLVWLDLVSGERHYKEPNTSLWQRFMASFLSWLPIESHL
ncbi:phospholipase D family protein [Shewanella sp. WXL01]|uniref:phospholipase D family protein n=1 Tax=Shewanella sp. WXL01 TaxID=2709721 RepID=UPI0014382674|nr:phospholipase D family protein [Shewanella sp. WXL01]